MTEHTEIPADLDDRIMRAAGDVAAAVIQRASMIGRAEDPKTHDRLAALVADGACWTQVRIDLVDGEVRAAVWVLDVTSGEPIAALGTLATRIAKTN